MPRRDPADGDGAAGDQPRHRRGNQVGWSGPRSRTEAAGLAQSKVSELVAFAQSHQLSETSLEGDFGPDWPNYHWKAVVNDWTNDPYPVGMQQLDVQVTWPLKNPTDSVTLSTLVYVRPLSN